MVTDLEIWYQKKDLLDVCQHHKKQKHSGLIVCTGTGSTGWTKSSNHICAETIQEVLQNLTGSGYIEMGRVNQLQSEEEIQKITDEINDKRTLFRPDDNYLGLTFREPISNKISTENRSNFLKIDKIVTKSKLKYGMLSIDGSTYYDFCRGSIVECTVDPSKALICVDAEAK